MTIALVRLCLLVVVGAGGAAQTVVTTTTTAPRPAPAGPATAGGLPETGTGLVMGRVVDEKSGRPVPGAIVTIGSTATVMGVTSFGGGPTVVTTTPGALNGRPGPSTLRVITDSDGRFAFLDLPAGKKSFSVNASGYVGGGYGQRRPTGPPLPLDLAEGERLGEIVLPMWKYAAISGTVTDEAGEPVVGVPVRLLERTIVAGRMLLKPATQSGRTDDRGVYRIGLLVPGDYVIAVAVTHATTPLATVETIDSKGAEPFGTDPLMMQVSRMGGVTSLPGHRSARQVGDVVERVTPGLETQATGSRALTYQTVFYPSARTPAEATVVSVASGDERVGMDVQLQLSATVRVSGHVNSPQGPLANVALYLVPAGVDRLASETGFETSVTSTNASGAFTFLGVTPGSYLLRAVHVPLAPSQSATTTTITEGPRGRSTSASFRSPSLSELPSEPALTANMPVVAGNDDIGDLSVMLSAGPHISGRVEFDGALPRPSAEALGRLIVVIEASDARSLSGRSLASIRGVVDANGRVMTTSVPPGRYMVRASAPPGWTFKAAMHDGRDVSTTPLGIDASDVTDLVLIYTDHPSAVSGMVHGANGASPDAAVFLFPADDQAWVESGATPRRMKMTRASSSGAFEFSAVPSGDYFIAAVRDELAGEWPDPTFLTSLRAQATRVSVADGDKKFENLRVIK
jgi:hypothetical protein